MRVTDPTWLHLAQLAGVRPPHCWHLFCYLKAVRGKFNASAYAAFANMDIKHVTRMLDVFASEGIVNTSPEPVKAANLRGSRLPRDFAVPLEWIAWAIAQRRWTQDVAETVAAEFVAYWADKAGKDALKVSWDLTWQNWVRRSHKPNGEEPKGGAFQSPEQWRTFCQQELERATERHNRADIMHWRRELEKL